MEEEGERLEVFVPQVVRGEYRNVVVTSVVNRDGTPYPAALEADESMAFTLQDVACIIEKSNVEEQEEVALHSVGVGVLYVTDRDRVYWLLTAKSSMHAETRGGDQMEEDAGVGGNLVEGQGWSEGGMGFHFHLDALSSHAITQVPEGKMQDVHRGSVMCLLDEDEIDAPIQALYFIPHQQEVERVYNALKGCPQPLCMDTGEVMGLEGVEGLELFDTPEAIERLLASQENANKLADWESKFMDPDGL